MHPAAWSSRLALGLLVFTLCRLDGGIKLTSLCSGDDGIQHGTEHRPVTDGNGSLVGCGRDDLVAVAQDQVAGATDE